MKYEKMTCIAIADQSAAFKRRQPLSKEVMRRRHSNSLSKNLVYNFTFVRWLPQNH